jgi:hypothetical protein
MDKIHSINVEKAFEVLSNTLITPRFLELVEKWSRFDGIESLVSGDITVTNMGTFQRTVQVADIDFSKDIMKQVGSMLGGNGKKKDEIEIYDVTKISNDVVMTEYNSVIFIAKREKDNIDRISFPMPLFIYSICEDETKETKRFPTFNTLKKDFESNKRHYYYNSLIEDSSYKGHSLLPYNDETDRIKNYSSIQGDIRSLESDEDALLATKHIKVPKRFTYEGLQAYKEKERKKLHDRLKKDK